MRGAFGDPVPLCCCTVGSSAVAMRVRCFLPQCGSARMSHRIGKTICLAPARSERFFSEFVTMLPTWRHVPSSQVRQCSTPLVGIAVRNRRQSD